MKRIKQKIKNKLVYYSIKLIERISPTSLFIFLHRGYCPCCDNNVAFKATNSWLRDYFICTECLCIPRERAIMLTIEKYYPNWRDLNIHESSPGNRGASKKMKQQCKKYLSSQYYPNQYCGNIIDNNRNEDLENQTFPDECFDIVVTQDVLEHLYNPEKAFKEIARTLKPGGAHIFTVPIVNKHNQTQKWAIKMEDGSPKFLHKEEWHGNPVDSKGSPVTYHYGFDIVDIIKKSSGLDTTIEYINNLDYGIRAEYIEVLITKKQMPTE